MSKLKENEYYLGTHVHCPNWQCSGSLFTRQVKGDQDEWQMPDIVCDDCGTVFVNSLRLQQKVIT